MPSFPPEFMERMQACMEAGMPGKMHARLAQSAGTWDGQTTMWFMPDSEPMKSTCVAIITPIFDGRFVKVEIEGDMGEMGRFRGLGINGFDNTTEKFQSVWIDDHSSLIMVGTGELSSDGKALTWKYTFTDPQTKKPTFMREIERHINDNTMTFEMYGPDLSGKEYKMMEIRYTRRADKPTAGRPTTAAPGRTAEGSDR